MLNYMSEIHDEKNTIWLLQILAPHLYKCIKQYYTTINKSGDTKLTLREKQILNNFKNGDKPTEIGKYLYISERTVRFHLDNIVNKLHAKNKIHAITIALENNLLS